MSELVEEKVRESSLRDLYYVLFRHKWKIVLFFFAVVITVTVGTLLCAKVYRSEATLLVRLGRESVSLDPTATTGQVIQISRSRENEINSEVEILKSRDLLEKVVDSIGPEVFLKRLDEKLPADGRARETIRKSRQEVRAAVEEPRNPLERLDLVESLRDHEKAVLKVTKNLEIETLKDSSTISISYEAQSAKLAQEVINKLIKFYLEKRIAVYQTPGSYQFFTQQSDHLRNVLAKSENELWSLKNETGISSLEEQRGIILSRIGTLEQETERTEAALAASRAKVKELRRTLQPTLLAEQAILSSLEAKVEAQKRQLVDGQAELKALNDSEVRITRLIRELGIQEANYRRYSENLEQARIDHAMEADKISNISVVQAATLPIKPIRPRKLLNLALGFFLGIFGAIGLAFFSEYLDHSIKTTEEAEEKLQLPTLASIPSIQRVRADGVPAMAKQEGQAKNGGKIAEKLLQWNIPAKIREHYEVVRERLLRSNGSEPLPELAVTKEIREHYEAFRERVLLRSNGSTGAPYVLAVTSCRRGEGVSTIAANLAATLSRHDNGRVLLVDANIGHPLVHQIFEAKLSPGLTDVLANGQSNDDTIQSLPAHKLHILSAGTTNENLSEIFDSDGFTKLLTSIKNHYRFVVIDVPALNETSSSARLAGLCDGVVLVVEAEQLRWEVAQRAREQLVNSDANILGVVLNKRRFHVPAWLYQTL